MMKKKVIIPIMAVLVGAMVLFGFNRADNRHFEISKNLEIYYSLFKVLNTFYVDDIEPGELVKTSIDKMLEQLDPYTTFISESDMEDFRFMTTGEYAGIGALIGRRDTGIIITEPYEGFPAQKSGLKAGDILLEISGKNTKGMKTEDASELLKGPAGEPVVLHVARYGMEEPFELTVVRENIQIDPVTYAGMVGPETGYISLRSFTRDCGEKVKEALVDLKENQGAKKVILDLRGNPGGLLQEAVNISNIFIPKNQEVVTTKGKIQDLNQRYATTKEALDTDIPLAVLVNRGSASASEIVAGTMQDLDRGVIIGARTFGKGLVQSTKPLAYKTQLKVTTAKYYIPSGRCIQALDYSHRNEDGSVGKIPDSLITEFSTLNGRSVFDGGGIVPDIKVEGEEISNLSIRLIQQYKIFDFATKYSNENESVPEPEDFVITDEIFAEFVDFILSDGFKYTSQTEDVLKELKEVAKAEKYFQISESEFNALEEKLGHDIETDLYKFRDEIEKLMVDEILSRYYYKKGAIKAALKDDNSIKKAIEVLDNSEEYAGILKP